MERVLTVPAKSPPNTPSATAAGREDQSDFWTANPNSAMKSSFSFSSASATSLLNDGEGGSKATSMKRLSSTASLGPGLGLGEAAGGLRTASSREQLAPEEIRLSGVDHFQVEELADAASRESRPASLDGERLSLMGGSESEAAPRMSGNYGSMVDGGEDEKSGSA